MILEQAQVDCMSLVSLHAFRICISVFFVGCNGMRVLGLDQAGLVTSSAGGWAGLPQSRGLFLSLWVPVGPDKERGT